MDISCLNYAVITLIPKVKGADLISQFRPIALINNFAKFPAKGFATRLSPIAHRTINPFQSAFIKDFEKAYDSVSWPFLRKFLLAKGFEGSYVHRIMQLVSGGHTAISVNGQQWKSLTKAEDQDALNLLISKVRASASSLCRQEQDA
ncbi:uncharacterized protein [Aegilops tauschii subsp. strangulata]|uniref:uncharacterized protein n=1 Tax=Aegilops tauschii subsp. strangulata TaxID=200361 RepID=UPI003CC88F0A